MNYRCVATSLEGFVQQIATSYLTHGYYYYVTGRVPAHKNPEVVDAKLVRLYGIDCSKWQRARRKRAGFANLQYLRWDRFWILIATAGKHEFFSLESSRDQKGRETKISDVRHTPIKVGGYSIGHSQGHAHVRIELQTYRKLRAYFWDLSTRRKPETLAREFYNMPFESYAPIRRQLLNILRLVNKRRKVGGYTRIPYAVLHLRRRVVKPFEVVESELENAA